MMKFTVESKALKAASFASAINEVRNYLNGVCVQINAAEPELALIGTDGHRLHHCISETEIEGDLQDSSLIIPNATVKAALNLRKSVLTFEPVMSGRWLIDDEILFRPIEGKFPDLKYVFPKEISGEKAQYNPSHLLDAHKAIRAYKGTPVTQIYEMLHNGKGAGIISQPGITCIIMPVNGYIESTRPLKDNP